MPTVWYNHRPGKSGWSSGVADRTSYSNAGTTIDESIMDNKILFLFTLLVVWFGNNYHTIAQNTGSETRSAMGIPGPDYWQNQANYQIEVELDDQQHAIAGEVVIDYHNYSPHQLPYLWLHLDQNRFKADSRGAIINNVGGRHDGSTTTGMTIEEVQVDAGNGFEPADYIITDSRMQIRLKQPLEAQRGNSSIKVSYAFTVPEYGADRTGRILLKNGWIYEVAHWYPRVAVFDDANGWDTAPYLGGGEFYCEFGNFEYAITLPSDYLVMGSGSLINPEEVLTDLAQRRLAKARQSDKTIFIIKPNELGKKRFTQDRPTLTWRFRMDQTRDVAWACSKGFIWDAATAGLPNGKEALVMSAYPEESKGNEAWGQATAYGKAVLEHYAKKWGNYPYPTLVNVAGVVGGMEYPGLHFTKYDRGGNTLWRTLDHEVAHNWFPMIVGSNERQHAWMDEGLVTFMGYYSAKSMGDGQFASYISHLPIIYGRLPNWSVDPVMTPPDQSQAISFSDVIYFKPAVALLILREYILGGDRFDYAFQQYIQAWSYKHPTPDDLFNCIENASGEDLDWFWDSWFYSTDQLDQAIVSVGMEDEEPSIVVKNKGGMPLPLEMAISFEDNSTELIRLPAEIWFKGDSWIQNLDTDLKVSRVELDPRGLLPDINRKNNVWEARE